MGSTNGISRGQLRPHFSGRSPPFLLAALCVGLGILGVSYWSLSTQYNDLEEQLKKALQRKESIENDQNFIQNQLHLREEEFSRAKVSLQKKEQEITDFNNQLKAKTDEIISINSKLETLKDTNNKCNEDLIKKENSLGDAMTKLKEVEEQRDKFSKLNDDQNNELSSVKLENQQLKTQLEELRKQINTNNINSNKNNSLSSVIPASNVGQSPIIESNNVLPSEEIANNLLRKPNPDNKETQKSQAEAPNDLNGLSAKQQEPVIAEPLNAQQNPSMTGLEEDVKKEDALVDAPAVNGNADDFKADLNKEEEESRDKQQL